MTAATATDLDVRPRGSAAIGADVRGPDLAEPMTPGLLRAILQVLGRHKVLCFPDQRLQPAALAAFSRHFGELEVNVSGLFQLPEQPEVMVLSNIVRDGKPLGAADAGQGWHTDMSYSRTIAFVNILHALQVPMRDGRPLGDTQFRDMEAAWDDLPADLRARLSTLTATHDYAKFWDMMRARPGNTRPPLTSEQRRAKPPVSHPIGLRHPLTGRTVLYANPGYAVSIDGLPEAEGRELLEFLFRHQMQDRYLHAHHWRPGDLLMWDNIATIHNAVADYGPAEHRLIHRTQVMATLDFEALSHP